MKHPFGIIYSGRTEANPGAVLVGFDTYEEAVHHLQQYRPEIGQIASDDPSIEARVTEHEMVSRLVQVGDTFTALEQIPVVPSVDALADALISSDDYATNGMDWAVGVIRDEWGLSDFRTTEVIWAAEDRFAHRWVDGRRLLRELANQIVEDLPASLANLAIHAGWPHVPPRVAAAAIRAAVHRNYGGVFSIASCVEALANQLVSETGYGLPGTGKNMVWAVGEVRAMGDLTLADAIEVVKAAEARFSPRSMN